MITLQSFTFLWWRLAFSTLFWFRWWSQLCYQMGMSRLSTLHAVTCMCRLVEPSHAGGNILVFCPDIYPGKVCCFGHVLGSLDEKIGFLSSILGFLSSTLGFLFITVGFLPSTLGEKFWYFCQNIYPCTRVVINKVTVKQTPTNTCLNFEPL